MQRERLSRKNSFLASESPSEAGQHLAEAVAADAGAAGIGGADGAEASGSIHPAQRLHGVQRAACGGRRERQRPGLCVPLDSQNRTRAISARFTHQNWLWQKSIPGLNYIQINYCPWHESAHQKEEQHAEEACRFNDSIPKPSEEGFDIYG